MSNIKVGDKVRVTKSAYLRAAPVGTVGTVYRINHAEVGARYTIDREDETGLGWCEEVESLTPMVGAEGGGPDAPVVNNATEPGSGSLGIGTPARASIDGGGS